MIGLIYCIVNDMADSKPDDQGKIDRGTMKKILDVAFDGEVTDEIVDKAMNAPANFNRNVAWLVGGIIVGAGLIVAIRYIGSSSKEPQLQPPQP